MQNGENSGPNIGRQQVGIETVTVLKHLRQEFCAVFMKYGNI